MDLDACDAAVGLVLPKMPGPQPIFDRGVVLGRADPDRVVHKGAVRKDRLVKVDRRVDDRPFAVVALHLLQHHLHVGDGALLSEMAVAGRGGRRRLDVEHRRQGVVLDRRVLLEKGHLLDRRPAPVDEMIGAVRNAGGLGAGPVGLEMLIEAIAALGRLDPGEFDAAIGDRVPVDVALELGDIDAVDRVVLGVGIIQTDDIQGAAAAAAPATRQRGGKRERDGDQSAGSEKLAVRHHRPVKIAPRTVVSPDNRLWGSPAN